MHSFCVLSIFLIVCWTSVAKSELQIEEFGKGINSFGFDLYQECSALEPGNVIISPFSMAALLTLLSQATNGTTYEELRKVLYLNSDKSAVADQYQEYFKLLEISAGRSELMVANRIYVQQGFELNKNFHEITANKFSTGVELVDFRRNHDTAQLINNFVAEKTKGRINQTVTPNLFDDSTRVFLVNSIYLKSLWHQPFSLCRTHRQPFYISDTETVDVDFMQMKENVWHAELDELDIAALRLDYANSNFSFIIILPNNRTGLTTLETQLQNVSLCNIIDKMRFHKCEVTIPKFKIQSEFHMKDILKKMGMNEIFGLDANLSGLLKSKERLFVSHVIHKATIEINEVMTEASAVSGVVGVTRMGAAIFLANHLFMYFVWDRESKTTIFSGRIKTFDETEAPPKMSYCGRRRKKFEEEVTISPKNESAPIT